MASRIGASECAAARYDGWHSTQEYAQVQAERPVLDIGQIEDHHFLEIQTASTADLPEAGHARRHLQPFQVPRLVLFHLGRQRRSGPDQAHVALENVE